MTLTVEPNAYNSKVINISGTDFTFTLAADGSVIAVQVDGNDVSVTMASATVGGKQKSVANIQWSATTGLPAVGIDDSYWFIDTYMRTGWETTTTRNVSVAEKRYSLVNTINLDDYETANFGTGIMGTSKFSDSAYIYIAMSGGGARRYEYADETYDTVSATADYTGGYLFKKDDDTLIGVYTSSGVVYFDELVFSSDTVTNVASYTYSDLGTEGYKVMNHHRKIVWFSLHKDSSYPTSIYAHTYDMDSSSMTHNQIYSFSSPSTYWTSGTNPNVTFRCTTAIIGETVIFFPTILTNQPSTVFGLILFINKSGSGDYIERAYSLSSGSRQLTFDNTVVNYTDELVYVFHQGWDSTEDASYPHIYMLSSIAEDGTKTDLLEWGLDPDAPHNDYIKYPADVVESYFPCVFMVGSRQHTYRIDKHGDVYSIPDDDLINNIGLLYLPSVQTSGTVNWVYYNVDDVYERLFFRDDTNGDGYLDCDAGTITRVDLPDYTGPFDGSRLVETSPYVIIYYTPWDNLTTTQQDYINAA